MGYWKKCEHNPRPSRERPVPLDDEEQEITRERKYGSCPRCREVRSLAWFLAQNKRTGALVSGWLCDDCMNKVKTAQS